MYCWFRFLCITFLQSNYVSFGITWMGYRKTLHLYPGIAQFLTCIRTQIGEATRLLFIFILNLLKSIWILLAKRLSIGSSYLRTVSKVLISLWMVLCSSIIDINVFLFSLAKLILHSKLATYSDHFARICWGSYFQSAWKVESVGFVVKSITKCSFNKRFIVYKYVALWPMKRFYLVLKTFQ